MTTAAYHTLTIICMCLLFLCGTTSSLCDEHVLLYSVFLFRRSTSKASRSSCKHSWRVNSLMNSVNTSLCRLATRVQHPVPHLLTNLESLVSVERKFFSLTSPQLPICIENHCSLCCYSAANLSFEHSFSELLLWLFNWVSFLCYFQKNSVVYISFPFLFRAIRQSIRFLCKVQPGGSQCKL